MAMPVIASALTGGNFVPARLGVATPMLRSSISRTTG